MSTENYPQRSWKNREQHRKEDSDCLVSLPLLCCDDGEYKRKKTYISPKLKMLEDQMGSR